MSSTLEHLRQQHEDMETLKQLASKALQARSDPSALHPRLQALPHPLQNATDAEHLAASLIASAHQHAVQLHSFYTNTNSDSSLATSFGVAADNNASSMFYASLRDLRDAHRTNASHSVLPHTLSSPVQRDASLLASFHPIHFSGEEASGRLLDLQSHFRHFVNLTGSRNLLYHQYVRDAITHFDSVPSSLRWTTSFFRYLDSLLIYLSDFARRAHPLDNVQKHIDKTTQRAVSTLHTQLEEIAQQNYSPQLLLNALGDSGIKTKLASYALKSGGRPLERAQRLWDAAHNRHFGQAVIHHQVICFLLERLLADERASTVASIENKLSLNYDEIEAERKAAEAGAHSVSQTHQPADTQHVENTVYNPKDVPLGWDGKPIPYWMYKLHGLNHEFKCEICGGGTYKGPRAFERHFTETIHVGGLRRLGIGFSKSFMMITGIQDALQLHQRLVSREKSVQFDLNHLVEVEDNEGNVMNVKTMNDLKRQGLL